MHFAKKYIYIAEPVGDDEGGNWQGKITAIKNSIDRAATHQKKTLDKNFDRIKDDFDERLGSFAKKMTGLGKKVQGLDKKMLGLGESNASRFESMSDHDEHCAGQFRVLHEKLDKLLSLRN